MIVIPLLIIIVLATLIILFIWGFMRRRFPSKDLALKYLIAMSTLITGIFYLVAPLVNVAINYGLLAGNFRINLNEEEILATAIIVGLVFFLIGIADLVKLFKRTR